MKPCLALIRLMHFLCQDSEKQLLGLASAGKVDEAEGSV